jgi:transcriptional regulator with XRE-family HTH domain
LKSVRKARRLSLKQLSNISGVSQGAICDVEKGRRVPGRDITNKLAKALSLDLAEVYSRSGRLPDDVTNYMISHPNAGALLQKLVKFNFSDRSLVQIVLYLTKLYEMAKDRKMKQGGNKHNISNRQVEQVEQVDNTTPSVSNVINELQQEQEEEQKSEDDSDDDESDDENENEEDDFDESDEDDEDESDEDDDNTN